MMFEANRTQVVPKQQTSNHGIQRSVPTSNDVSCVSFKTFDERDESIEFYQNGKQQIPTQQWLTQGLKPQLPISKDKLHHHQSSTSISSSTRCGGTTQHENSSLITKKHSVQHKIQRSSSISNITQASQHQQQQLPKNTQSRQESFERLNALPQMQTARNQLLQYNHTQNLSGELLGFTAELNKYLVDNHTQ